MPGREHGDVDAEAGQLPRELHDPELSSGCGGKDRIGAYTKEPDTFTSDTHETIRTGEARANAIRTFARPSEEIPTARLPPWFGTAERTSNSPHGCRGASRS